MILNDKILISRFNNRKLKYYSELGYDISNDYFYISVHHLNSGSREIVDVECDYCKSIVKITYKEYIRNISVGLIKKYSCCKKCGSDKAKESNLLKFGAISHMQLDSYKEMVKETNLERYGVEYLQQSNIFKEKSKKTILNKWGVSHYSKTDEFSNKIKNTSFDKWGVSHYSKTDDYKIKVKETSIDKWGVDNYSKTKEHRDKVKETSINKWGVDCLLKNEDIKNRIKKTNIKKFGVDNVMKSEIIRDEFIISNHNSYIKYLYDGYSLFDCDKNNNHQFEIKSDNFLKRFNSNLPICTICNPIGELKSIKEKELYEYIKSIYDGEIIQSWRDGQEIDIYLPELKIGFEFNGLWWHSEKFKEKNYHVKKTNHFKDRNIRIIHIWEDDWVFKNEIIKSQIINWLGLTTFKIYARLCEVREIVDSKLTKNFLNSNHIQGYVNSKIKIGLYYKDELVSLMTFDQFEGRKRMLDSEWNLNRFCNKLNTNVVGGSSKLLNFFIISYNPYRIISYADKDWSVGNLYYKLGFYIINNSNPDYKYILDSKRVHKSKFRKNKLNTNLTESQEMMDRNVLRIWDCGKIKFELILREI